MLCADQVLGKTGARPLAPHSLLLSCTRVPSHLADAPDARADDDGALGDEGDPSSQYLSLVGSIDGDLRLMHGKIFRGRSPRRSAGAGSELGGEAEKHDAFFEVYSVRSVPVPPSYFARYARRVISLSSGFIQFVGEDDECGVVQAAQPVTPADNYVEVSWGAAEPHGHH